MKNFIKLLFAVLAFLAGSRPAEASVPGLSFTPHVKSVQDVNYHAPQIHTIDAMQMVPNLALDFRLCGYDGPVTDIHIAAIAYEVYKLDPPVQHCHVLRHKYNTLLYGEKGFFSHCSEVHRRWCDV